MNICNECGRNVGSGSGLRVDRIPDCNDVETRRAVGKPYPEGDWICRECEEKLEDVVE